MTEFGIGLKMHLHQKCLELIKEKIDVSEKEMQSLGEALANDSKSSAGDKHETSRAMTHLEQEKLGNGLEKLNSQLRQLQKINPEQSKDRVSSGALFRSNQGYFYVSTALGKIDCGDLSVFCLSSESPLAQVLSDLGKGESVSFNKNKITILDII